MARLMYTSGTTSRPKGVMITFSNLEAKNLAHTVEFGFTAAHRNLVCGPLYHVGGLDMVTTSMLQVGGESHVLRRFDAAEALESIERLRITHVWMAPVMINTILADPSLGERDLSSVQLLSDGGEKMPLPLIERVLAAFPNAWFADGYGMTETVSGDTFLDKRLTTHKLGSVGRPVCNAEVRIVDEDDRPVPPNDARRDRHARAEGLQGIHLRRGGDGDRAPRRLAAHRRHRHARRGRVPVHPRPAQGHDPLGRREHRLVGGRTGPLRASGRVRGRGRRAPGRALAARFRSPIS